ncbi:hypothetical protein [Longispora albida]|uniref:hypothetical protein n=1 Tax=Longispora albida TaxID=203523 RepID=UPI00037C3684|nr:hypothetical protein [Longispora albida]
MALPTRPLSVGELLDAATELLRTRAKPLLLTGLGLAAAEQVLLTPLWDAVPPIRRFLVHNEGMGDRFLLLTLGMVLECLAISVLAILASRAVLRDLGGVPGSLASPIVTTVLVTVLTGVAALMCGVPWLVVYALLGLAVPIAVIDRCGPFGSLGRSVRLVTAGGMRAGGIRLLGYGAWVLIRLAFIGAAAWGLEMLDLDGSWYRAAGTLLINAIAYPALACLDVLLHLENRMRVEGLDIELGRTSTPDTVLRAAR